MGCQNSKAAQTDLKSGKERRRNSRGSYDSAASNDKDDRIYKLLVKAQQNPDDSTIKERIVAACRKNPEAAAYQNPTTKSTPLHMAVRLIDAETCAITPLGSKDDSISSVSVSASSIVGIQAVTESLVRAHPDAAHVLDAAGHIPLHYAVAPTTHFVQEETTQRNNWKVRTNIVRLLLAADITAAEEYLNSNSVVFQSGDATGGCTPLYRALQTLPDDFESAGPTVGFIALLHDASSTTVDCGNASDGDKPLALLYRRFTRQFDLAEKFFAGDNSRPDVVQHRRRYKTAAGNTWKIIELLLRPDTVPGSPASTSSTVQWQLVHRAVQVETPPDLLRYIVETNAQDLCRPDQAGNLPLHYAAKSRPPTVQGDQQQQRQRYFPAFYTKYVVDELLYKFPEAASTMDADGNYPLTLAVRTNKHWIGGGIKSLYDAYPEALEHIDLEKHKTLQTALSLDVAMNDAAAAAAAQDDEEDAKEEKVPDTIIQDEQHDAIMLVQKENVDVSEVVTSMWAHEEDAGLQMLGCVAIVRMVTAAAGKEADVLRISLSAVAAVVNAMKAHPNEVIIQEKACHALKVMAPADGKREVSFVASGAVAAVVGAMQAHVSDSGVQEEACGAVGKIIHYGGDDRATIVASVSGLTAIVNALAAHPDSAGVQRQACKALRELTEFPNANLPELPRSQTEPLLKAAKDKFPAECGEAAEVVLSRLV